jgi:hypothetical protein
VGDVLAAPSPPGSVTVHTGFLGAIQTWFTADHIGTALAFVLVAVLIVRFWKMFTAHPVLFAVAVIFVLVVYGVLHFGTLPHNPAHQPLLPPAGG